MVHTRRALLVSLAVLPLAATAAASADPIFAAIERHRAALAALQDVDEVADPDAYAEAEQENAAAYDALLATVPRTIPGCQALVDHMVDVGGDVDDAVAVLRQALDRLATET